MNDGPDPADPTTEAVFSSISAQAQETNRIRVAALEDLVRRSGDGAPSEDTRMRAKDLAHQIAGSAGTFGFVRASELAREIEAVLLDRDGEDSIRLLRGLLTDLRRSLD